jgi:hypothetical protein
MSQEFARSIMPSKGNHMEYSTQAGRPLADRLAEAKDEKTPPDKLQKLADDPDKFVRWYVARNPKISGFRLSPE